MPWSWQIGEWDGAIGGGGLVGQVVMDVAGDEEVEAAVAVVVAPGGAVTPVAEGNAGFFGHVGEGAVVVVAIEAVCAEVADEDVGPAVVVVIGDGHAEAPAVVGDAGLGGDVGECAVVVVVEEGSVGRFGFAAEGVVGGSVDEVDVEPAIVVVVDEADAGAVGFEDVLLGLGAHHVLPGGEAGGFAGVVKDDGAGVDEAAGGDGTVAGVVDRSEVAGRGDAAHAGLLLRVCGVLGLRCLLCR